MRREARFQGSALDPLGPKGPRPRSVGRKPRGTRLAVFAAILLSACAPHLPTPNTTIHATTYLPNQPVTPTPLPTAWWTIFRAPPLNALIAQGLAANPSIDEAAQNLAAANANGVIANSAFLPQLVLNAPGNAVASRQSYPTGPNGYPPYTIYSLTGTLTFDPGLFGARKFTFQNSAALADYQSAERDAARQTVAQNIATAAIAQAGAAAQITTTNQIIAAEQNLLTLLQGEYAAGAITRLQILQQQSVIQATQATLPPLQTQEDQQRDRLAILTGALPADFTAPPLDLNAFSLPANIPLALPSVYLQNRPDIRAARAQVAAQNAALGVAIAHLYPDFSLSATGGYASESLGSLFGTSSALWILAGNLLAPLYEGGALIAHKHQAQAQLAAALDAYKTTVLTAFAQAADALAAVQNAQTELSRATAAAATANDAYQLAAGQFRLGATDTTTVLTAQAAAAQANLIAAQARTNLLLAIATLQAIMAN
jgi:NodT family efflux transporter outer membrane factor (OMF) lipoprotein